MQRVFLVLILAWTAFPASAAKRMTVAQLEEQLKAATAAHKRDEEIARRITEAELSERLTDVSLDRLTKEAAQFPQSAQALQLLADQSAFLDPPPGELPATAALDAPSQQQVLNAARIYAGQVLLPRLPDFLGTRTISRYDDSPWAAKKGDWGVRQGLRLVDTSSQEISVSMERENQPPAESSAVWKAQIGLISGGEFGTTLEMIMTDTAQGRVSWDHWETTAAGQMAVFPVLGSSLCFAFPGDRLQRADGPGGPRVGHARFRAAELGRASRWSIQYGHYPYQAWVPRFNVDRPRDRNHLSDHFGSRFERRPSA